jgi:hypothetical protein
MTAVQAAETEAGGSGTGGSHEAFCVPRPAHWVLLFGISYTQELKILTLEADPCGGKGLSVMLL